jgi:hypothetical protein
MAIGHDYLLECRLFLALKMPALHSSVLKQCLWCPALSASCTKPVLYGYTYRFAVEVNGDVM